MTDLRPEHFQSFFLAKLFIQLFHAVTKGRNQENIRKYPGQRRSKTYRRITKDGHHGKTHKCPGYHLKNTGKYSKAAESQTLNRKTININKHQGNKEQGIG